MAKQEDALIAIPRINPTNFNSYVDIYNTTYLDTLIDVYNNTKLLLNTAIAMLIRDAGTTGLKGFIHVPYACTITGYSILADAAGDVVIDIWKDVFANFPPTVADTITAAAKPTLAAAQGILSTVLTGWTVDIAAGDVIAINIDSVTTIAELTITIFVEKVV